VAVARNSLRGRIERRAKEIGLFAAVSVGLVGVVAVVLAMRGAKMAWLIVVIATALVGVIVWVTATNTAGSMLRELLGVTEKVKEFNRGNKSARAWSSGTLEIRQLVEQINRMAEESESALEEIHAEDRRESHFVSDVSHELRTPLTSIRGAAETLLEGDVPPEDQARFLNMIISESSRLSRLANDLLTLQRIEGGTGEIRLSRFDLMRAVERAGETLYPLIEMRGVHFEVCGTPAAILGDIDRIQQIVVNLVDNASRVVGEGGHVWIEFSTVTSNQLGPLIHEVGLADVEHFALMCVRDDGPGIPEGDIPHLFDRFYRHQYSRDRKTGGSGLGLSIVKAIVKSHAGAIRICNGGDKLSGAPETLPEACGACFMIYLPIPPEPDIERLARLQDPSEDLASRTERIRRRVLYSE